MKLALSIVFWLISFFSCTAFVRDQDAAQKVFRAYEQCSRSTQECQKALEEEVKQHQCYAGHVVLAVADAVQWAQKTTDSIRQQAVRELEIFHGLLLRSLGSAPVVHPVCAAHIVNNLRIEGTIAVDQYVVSHGKSIGYSSALTAIDDAIAYVRATAGWDRATIDRLYHERERVLQNVIERHPYSALLLAGVVGAGIGGALVWYNTSQS